MTDREPRVDITLLVCTYNRCRDLSELLETALNQETDGVFTYEVLVVDNNSNDVTHSVVDNFVASGHDNLRYLFEPRQGRGYALNTGLAQVRGDIYAIADDDLILPPNYLKTIFASFQKHPEISFLGGKVLPLWRGTVPDWLTHEHWSAIAMADYGESQIHSDISNPITLLAGAFRLSDVVAVGGYHDELGVGKDKIGGTEDADLHTKMWQAGLKGLYVPQLYLHHKVEPHRLTKAYHRKWHTGHGAFFAAMRDNDFERSAARFFDIPSHVYKQAALSAASTVKCLLQRDTMKAFIHETHLRFLGGYARRRFADFRSSDNPGIVHEVRSLLRFLTRRTR